MSDPAPDPESRRLSAILFSDIVGYSRLMEADEDATLSLLTEHNAIVSDMIKRHKGALIKYIGDAAMAVFDSASDAVRCALAIQRAMAERNAAQPAARRLLLRIGVSVGDVVTRDGDVFGNGVNLAARVQPLAEPGGVCVTEMAHGLVAGQPGLRFESMGPRPLKNIKQPVTLYKVLDEGAPASSRPRVPSGAARGLAVAAAMLALGWGAWRLRPAGGSAPKADEFYIAVAPFNARTESAVEQASAMRTIIRRKLEQELEPESGISVGGAEIKEAPRTLDQARATALRIGADVVIWGDVIVVGGTVELQPFLTLDRRAWNSNALAAVRYRPGAGVDPLSLMRDNAREIGNTAILAAAEYFLELDPGKALSLLRRVDPPCETSRMQEARALGVMGDWAGAEKAIRGQLELTPKSSQPRRVLAVLFLGSGRGEEAVAELQASLAADPKDADAHRLLGIAYKRFGRFEEAGASFRRAAALKPGSALPHIELGALHQAQGRWRESADEYRIALAREPEDEYAKLLYAQALQRAGRAREGAAAIAALAGEADPSWPHPVAQVLAGRLTEAELFAQVETVADPYIRQDRLAEARYYLGVGRILSAAPSASREAAKDLLRLAADAPLKHILFEKDLAGEELKRF